ncbi:hypothetical protein C6P42_004638 [Pichia californica]|nr:hypothetical protein C6P42_004638 [[Candida] californica]
MAATLNATSIKDIGIVSSYRDHCPSFDNYNISYKIPNKTIKNEIASFVKKIESTPGFNPNTKFDAKKHIIFDSKSYKTTKIFTLNDLNISKTHIDPINNFGAAFPFELLSSEAVNMLLWEAFQPEVIENYSRLPNLSKDATRLDFHVGGHFKIAPFTNDLANSEELSEIVSTFVGHKMKPVWESDRVHINVCLATNDDDEIAKNYCKSEKEIKEEYERQYKSNGSEISSITGVHYDSISIPLVIMLDLPSDAEGGQTTIITGNESSTSVPDPPTGSGSLIQGRVLRHLGSKPITNHNRISFVLSYATGVDGELDNCVVTSVKPSVLPKNEFNKFYRDWIDYKFGKLEAHLNMIRKNVVKDYEAGESFDQEDFVSKCVKIEKYIHDIYGEMECVNLTPYPPPHFNLPYSEL